MSMMSCKAHDKRLDVVSVDYSCDDDQKFTLVLQKCNADKNSDTIAHTVEGFLGIQDFQMGRENTGDSGIYMSDKNLLERHAGKVMVYELKNGRQSKRLLTSCKAEGQRRFIQSINR